MSNLSSYTSHLLSNRQSNTSQSSSSSRQQAPLHGQPGASSHFRFDPLLRSTFGHRSIDLYGSQVDNEDDHYGRGREGEDSYRDDEGDVSPSVSFQSTTGRGRRGAPGGFTAKGGPSGTASSTLLHASRYGPARPHRKGSALDIPEISDEEDDDEEQEEREQRWGRGLDLKAFESDARTGGRSGVGLDSVDSMPSQADGDYTPSASLMQGASRSQRGRRASEAPSGGVDPFLVEDDDDYGDTTQAQQRAEASRSSNTAPASPRRSDKGKSRVPPPTHPQRDLSSGRGWLAHSIAPATKKKLQSASPGKRVRPPRDAYSIYDDEDEGGFTSDEGDEDDEKTQSELSEEDEERLQSSMPYRDESRGAQRRDGAESTIHYPAKLDASSFPRRSTATSAPYHDDFTNRVVERTGISGGSASGPAGQESRGSAPVPLPSSDSILQEPSPLLGALSSAPSLNLTSWSPFSRGNNPAFKEWKDQPALLVWIVALAVTILVAGGASLGVRSPLPPSTPSIRPSPYYTLTRSLPLLILLSALSLLMAVVHLAFLRNLDRFGGTRILRFALVAVPSILTLGWVWAFGASFFYSDEAWSGGLWSTTGLRLLSLFPLLCAIAFSRLLYLRRAQLDRSLSVLALSARIISAHPSLLILAVLQIFLFLALSIPFLTIFIRLFLLGHFYHPSAEGSSDVWITDRKARLLAWFTLATWIWTWSALRGVMRVIVAATVSHWYFYGPPSREEQEEDEESGPAAGAFAKGGRGVTEEEEEGDETGSASEDGTIADEEESEILGLGGLGEEEDAGPSKAPGAFSRSSPAEASRAAKTQESPLAHRNPTSANLVRSSFLRATGPSLGTILLSSLLLSLSTLLLILSSLSRLLASLLSSPSIPLPTIFHPLAHLAYLLSGVGNVLGEMSEYTLIYSGITGRGFWKSTRRCGRLVARRGVKGLMEGLLISTILSLLSISLSFLAALAGFLFSAHQLHVPADAPLVGLMCGIVPYWVLRLSGDLLGDGADTLYLCYAIDTQAPQDGGATGGAGQQQTSLPGSFPFAGEGRRASHGPAAGAGAGAGGGALPGNGIAAGAGAAEGRGSGAASEVGKVFAGVEVDHLAAEEEEEEEEGEGLPF
ncbi:hypothetical protein BCV69DRAFT_314839 [Microstroma glucosiphilum]|uniref:Uncharacterized protein n=1 Tax=Pseudomicrostroma glucosiphilum TaxID=1684307 RepID=A0A316TYF0_9BASI|nr:hypothetical protein BCV69DRAFT_314839 [Pseudomicrostroma glucosiphilum]PWN18319.1 hypothetical protein BCV69DRAFT_314839 [Pseudomicrostroma glucosiphilum]